MDNFYARYPVTGGSGGVSSLNGLTGALTLVGTGGITVTPGGTTITLDGSGFANTALSNLIATSINQSLVPNADVTYMLGSQTLRWGNLFADQWVDGNGNIIIQGTNRQLFDDGGVPAIDFSAANRLLNDTAGNPSMNYAGRTLFDAATILSIDFGNRQLVDSTGVTAVTWDTGAGMGNRKLLDNSGNVALNFKQRTLIDSSGVESQNWDSRVLEDTGAVTALNYSDPTKLVIPPDTGSSLPRALSFRNGGDTNGSLVQANNSISSDTLFQLPPTNGASGQLLQTDGTGVTSWATAAQVNTMLGDILANGTVPFTASQSMGSNTLTNLANPVGAQDATPKSYVDSAIAALNPATSVYAATTGSNIPGTYSNGVSGVGATFTTTATGTFTVDGTTPALNARILIKDQSSGFQNGIYTITTLGTVGVQTIFTRAADYNTAADMNSAGLIPVINGTVNALSSWQQVATITTVGTDSLVFTEFTANPSLYLLKANNLNDVASKSTSFNNLSPMTTGGDLIYGGASGAGTRLPNGSSGNLLMSNGGTSAPSWLATANNSVLVTNGSGSPSLSTQLPPSLGIGVASASTSALKIMAVADTNPGGLQILSAANNHATNFVMANNGQFYINVAGNSNFMITQSNSGTVGIGGTGSPDNNTSVTVNTSVDQIQLAVRGNSTQTHNLQIWETSANVILAFMDQSGNLTANTITASGSPIAVSSGGTGDSSFTAYSVITGGTTSTSALQNVSGVGTTGQVLTSNGAGALPTWQTAAASSFKAPTIQQFTTGSGTYTTPTTPAPLYIRVVMVGGGGGAGGSTANGSAGNDSTFGSSLLDAGGGSAGLQSGSGTRQGGAGGTASLGSGPVGIALTGGSGGSGDVTGSSTGSGGNSAFGGGGASKGNGTATAGATNTGGGGGAPPGAGGGGSGGYIDAIITSPASTYAYTVGASAAGGSTGGAAGGSGLIVVYEYYQ